MPCARRSRPRPRRARHREWLVAVTAMAATTLLTAAAYVAPAHSISSAPVVDARFALSATSSSAMTGGTFVNHYTPRGYELLVIGPSNQYSQVVPAHSLAIRGTVTEAAGRLTFSENPGEACPGQPGTYNVSVEPKGIFLTIVHDPCSDRAADLTSSLWRPFAEHTSTASR